MILNWDHMIVDWDHMILDWARLHYFIHTNTSHAQNPMLTVPST